jgi:hypothetical protein
MFPVLNSTVLTWLWTFLIVVGSTSRGRADNGWERSFFSLNEDNDTSAKTDRHYTQGVRVSYFSKDDDLPGWMESLSNHLPALGLRVEAQKLGLAVGQEIYTPADLYRADVITNDRPYAGWLFTGLTLQRRGAVSPAWLAMESLRLDVGVVGPQSLAEAAQEAAHRVKPRGWGNQLKTEVAFDLRYDRRYLYQIRDRDERWGVDIIPAFVGSGGTVATFLGAGTTLRFGYRIPNEFEAAMQPTPLHYGAYLFTSADGRYVIRNIFLDGNTFASSAHIDKNPFVAELRAGLVLVFKCVELTFAQTLRTREFAGQGPNDSYGTAAVTVKF